MVMRKNLIESDHSELSIHQQCHIVNVPRSNYYYQSVKKLTKQEQAWLDGLWIAYIPLTLFWVTEK